jgi:glutamate/tyrosine decarboxylase-like PLP-dependent enzyme
MSASAAYLAESQTRDPHLCVPEMSRRARAIEIWAALRSLGRTGLADLIDGSCEHARRFAEAFKRAGYHVLNDVVSNQVLVSFGAPEITRRVIARAQEDGTCWCGGTLWHGKTAMRVSVSSWVTTERDVSRSIEAILRIAAEATAYA